MMTEQEFYKRYIFDRHTDILGKGGFGKVFKAWDSHRHVYVAIKMQEVDYQYPNARLSKEVELAHRLDHPNVAKYLECYTFENHFGEFDFAVMNYYDSGSLDRWIGADLPLSVRYDILTQILEGIAYLHREGIIHRDLKPQNILMIHHAGWYIPLITDFGISKQLDDGQSRSVSNSSAFLTPHYASPEQLFGRKINKHSDLWSFGVIAYRMLVGSMPFDTGGYSADSESGRSEFIRQVSSGVLPEAICAVSEPWQSVIRGCLVVDGDKRFQHAEDCLALIANFVDGEEIIKVDVVAEGDDAIVVDERVDAEHKDDKSAKDSKDNVTPPLPSGSPKRKQGLLWLVLLLLLVGVVVGVFMFGGGGDDKLRDTKVDSKPAAEQIVSEKPEGGEQDIVALKPVPEIERPEPTSQPAQQPTSQPAPELTLTSSQSVTVGCDGGSGKINYTLTNSTSGVTLKISDNADWLTTSKSGSTISYDVEANGGESSRTATIKVSYDDQYFEVKVKQEGKPKATTGTHNGYSWVDLGLSVKWATCNVGANSPEDYGDYYAWGETSTKGSYTENTCSTWEQNIGNIAGTSRDVAHVKWGGNWRMPTKAEFDELLNENNCTWTGTTQNGKYGCKVTSKKNGNSIFLPAAGCRGGEELYYDGSLGYYWSSTPYSELTQYAYYLYFISGFQNTSWLYRNNGLTVRPVLE